MAYFGKPKIDNFNLHILFILVDQDKILWFQVSVDNASAMTVVYGLHDLLKNVACFILGEKLFGYNHIEKFSAFTQFSDEIDVFSIFEILV